MYNSGDATSGYDPYSPPPAPPAGGQKKTWIVIGAVGCAVLLLVVILGAAGGGGWLLYKSNSDAKMATALAPTATLPPRPTIPPTPLRPTVTRAAPPTRQPTVAIPTDTPVPPTQDPALWPVLLSDSFGSDSGEWTTGDITGDFASGAESIAGGKYLWQMQAIQNVAQDEMPSSLQPLSDFRVSVEARAIGAPSTADFGLQFRVSGDNKYYFGVSNSATYSLWRRSGGSWTSLIAWTSSSAIRPAGEVNRLTVIAKGSNITLLINSQPVGEIDDSVLPTGRVGLMAQLHNGGEEGSFEFDNFVLNAPGAPQPSLGSLDDTRAAVDSGVDALMARAAEDYGSEPGSIPGKTYSYTVTLDSSEPLLWFTGWCTSTQDILEDNWKHIHLLFLLNGAEVPAETLYMNEMSTSEGWACRDYSVLVDDWPAGTHVLTIVETFDQVINDGGSDFPAGVHTYEYTVTVGK
jgi:hypothetical protein